MTLAGEAQRLLLQRAVDATLVDALAHGLQALVVDDLHFADDASVEFLQSLAQSETLAALQWGFAQRPAEPRRRRAALRAALEEAGRLETARPAAARPGRSSPALVESIGLAELSAERLAPALLRHTGGNPMFALETLKDLVLSGRAAAIEPRRPPAAAGDGRRAGRAPARPADERGAAPGPRRRPGRAGVQRRARGGGARGASARHRRALARARDGAGAARRRLRP